MLRNYENISNYAIESPECPCLLQPLMFSFIFCIYNSCRGCPSSRASHEPAAYSLWVSGLTKGKHYCGRESVGYLNYFNDSVETSSDVKCLIDVTKTLKIMSKESILAHSAAGVSKTAAKVSAKAAAIAAKAEAKDINNKATKKIADVKAEAKGKMADVKKSAAEKITAAKEHGGELLDNIKEKTKDVAAGALNAGAKAADYIADKAKAGANKLDKPSTC